MKKILLSILCTCLIVNLSATNHTINTVGMTFSPSNLTINVGDSVTFVNTGGFHNVNGTTATFPSNPGSFSNPSGVSSGWVYMHVFTLAGTYNYQCDPHIPGMTGIIIVNSISVPGCTDSLACNYNSLATINDSSCAYPTTSTQSVTECDSYTWNGITYTSSGTYTYSTTNALGCDSTATLNLTINSSTLNTVSITTIGLYQWPVNGVMYTSSIIDTSIGFNSLGCQEINILDLTILPNPVDLFFSEYAEGNSNNKYFEIYNATNDTVDLTNYAFARVNNAPTTAGVYEYWVNFDSATAILPNDVYVVVHPSADSLILIHADMDYGSLSNGDDGFALVYGIQPTIPVAPGGDYIVLDWIGDWNGDPGQGWSVAGINQATRNNTLIRKCDVTNGDTSWTNSAGTDPVNSQWIVMGNEDWTNIGTHTISPCNVVYGCTDTLACNYDSNAVIDDGSCLYPGQIYQNNITICDGDSALIGSIYYSQSGLFVDSFINTAGCDSIIHTNLIIYSQFNPRSGGIPNNTIGGGGFFSGSQYLELSAYMPSELVSAMVYAQDTTLTTFQIRDDNGNVLDSTTVNVIPGGYRVYFNFPLTSGVNYELGVDGSSNNLYRNNAGVNYPYNFGSLAAITSSSAGSQYYYFFYDVEIKQLALPTNYWICDGDSLVIGNNTYTASGVYTDSITSSIGCDSLVFTNLVVNPNISYNNTKTICSGELTVVGSSVYDSTGVYVDTLTSSLGCDSIVTTSLTVLTIAGGTTINNQSICFGDSVSVGNSIYYYDGMYNDTLQDLNGCDSIIITTLVTTSAAYGSLYGGKPDTTNTLGMSGAFSSYNGQLNLDNTLPSILKSAAVYAQDTNSVTFELRDDNGMVLQNITHTVYPGLQRLNFNFLIPIDSNLHLGISMGGSGLYRNNAGNGNSVGYPYNIGPVTIKSANQGSTQYYYFYYDLEIISYGTYIDTTICKEDSVQIGGNTYNTAGTYIDTISTTSSCDSVVYTILDVYQSPPLTITSVPNPPEICLGDSIVLEGSPGFTYYWWDNGVVSDRLVDDPTVDTWYLLTAKDSNNCVVKEDIWVYVDSCISGIEYPLVNEISIYPNPTNGVLNIISDLNIEKISLHSIDGRLIEKTRNNSLFIKTKGIYFIKIKTPKGNITRRIVVN